MAPTKVDPAAAKQAKQKKILIVGVILLVAIMAFQLPKLMGGGKSTPAAEPATTTASTDPISTATTTAAAANQAITGAPVSAAAQTAPTTLATVAAPRAGKAQLASFSLFETKDPFVQQIKSDADTPGAAGSAAAAGAPAKGAVTKAAKGGGVAVKAVPTFATISVNGEPQAVEAKQEFPVDDPMFKLVSVGAKSAKIGIAGGSLANGKTVTLQMGKKLTLVNSATGARYTLDLLYTGTAPEETASFSAGTNDAGSTAPQPQTTTPAP
jgi:hypothetical protein